MHTDTTAWRRAWRLASWSVSCGLLAVPARASLWESQNWALTSTVTAAAGYDSNLTLSRDGPEDSYVQGSPSLTLLRRNSSSDLRVMANVTGTKFLRERQPDQLDAKISAIYAYPFAENVIPRYKLESSWVRTSEPNPYLGHRVRHYRAEASGEGYMTLTGKLGLTGAVEAYADNYVEPTLNHNNSWRVFTGIGYEKRPDLVGSLLIGYANGRSRPNRRPAGQEDVRNTEMYLTARVRGTITPKITGTVYGGFGQVKYRGGYRNKYNLPIVGADLTWGIDPRRTVVLAAYSGADYAPDGQAVNTSRAFLSFTHVVIGHWQYILRAGPTRTVFRREVRQATDNTWDAGAEFAYVPSERFRASLGVSFTNRDSDAPDRPYDRHAISLQSSYRF